MSLIWQITIVWMPCSYGIEHMGFKLCLVSIMTDANKSYESAAGKMVSLCCKITHILLTIKTMSHIQIGLNSLCPNDTIWGYRSWSILVPVMVCWLKTPLPEPNWSNMNDYMTTIFMFLVGRTYQVITSTLSKKGSMTCLLKDR